MSQSTQRWSRKATALLAAMAVSLFGALALAQPASAENVNAARDGNSSITVHKHAQGATLGAAGTGEELTTAPDDPLNLVDFTVYQLTGIDLTTETGWKTAQEIYAAIDGGASVQPNGDPVTSVTIGTETYPVGTGATQATNASGQTMFSSLDLGIYLVIEGDDNGDNDIVNPAPPFVVSVPTPAANDTWIYDVHVYPKNSVTSALKTADLGDLEDGNVVNWTITANVPYLTGANPSLTVFGVQDVLATGLSLVPGSSSVTFSSGTFTSPTHYSVTGGPTGTLNLAFTPAGLTQLETIQGGTVTWTFDTYVTSFPTATDGTVSNNATITVNDGQTEAGNEANFGQLTISKYASGSNAPLEGAVFHLYDAATGGNRVEIDGTAWEETSNGSGQIVVPVLKPGTYYLEEVTAPAGYKPLATRQPVTVVAGATTGTSQNYAGVANAQVDGWDLPLTGGSGTTLLILIGTSLVLIAGGAALVNQRRKNRQATH